jgi:hypothetical protein
MYCDNYATCGELILEQGTQQVTETMARVKGWHCFDGYNTNGDPHVHILGPRCVGTSRRLEPAPQVLPGQEKLF